MSTGVGLAPIPRTRCVVSTAWLLANLQIIWTGLGESPQAAKKSVQENARATVGSIEILAEYRYVTAKTLSVRQNTKARSSEIGCLSFGIAVRLLKKEKDFALVRWTDKDSGAEIQGWVFSRYLGKFN
jgi:hypothetical protein